LTETEMIPSQLLLLVGLVLQCTAHPHPEYEVSDTVPDRHLLLSEPIISGNGSWRYQYMPELLQLPESVHVKNAHGVTKDRDGNIYFTYEPVNITEDTRVLVRFAPDGTSAQLLGKDNSLAFGTPHGLRISYEKDGPYLYHANNDATVHKTTLEGDIVWTNNATDAWKGTKFWPFKPTDAVVPDGSDRVYVGDGYGSSFIHELNITDGSYSGLTFGGHGNDTLPQQFNCPHGVGWDDVNEQLVVSDRGNNRLQYVEEDGAHVKTVPMATGTERAAAGTQPCNVHLEGDVAVVPGLDGPVGIMDRQNMTVLSVLEVGQLLGPMGCVHPHDAIFLDNHDVIVCCWNPGFLSYWKRLPASE